MCSTFSVLYVSIFSHGSRHILYLQIFPEKVWCQEMALKFLYIV